MKPFDCTREKQQVPPLRYAPVGMTILPLGWSVSRFTCCGCHKIVIPGPAVSPLPTHNSHLTSHQLCLGAPRSHQRTWDKKDGAKPHQSSETFPQSRTWVPHISLVFGEMWDSTALSRKSSPRTVIIDSLRRSVSSQSRTQFINATSPHRKSGGA